MTRSTFLLFSLLLSFPLSAADRWVLQGTALGFGGHCAQLEWIGRVHFFNTNAADAVVRAEGSALPLVVPPGVVVSRPAQWGRNDPLYVMKLDVPDGVQMQARIDIHSQPTCPPFPPLDFGPVHGRIAIPAREELQPANQAYVHLGTDLGVQEARNNVAIYNAGDVAATASVDVRRACDDAVLDSAVATIAPRTLIQVTNLDAFPTCDLLGQTEVAPWIVYTKVTVDQPSLSWVSSIANQESVRVTYDVE